MIVLVHFLIAVVALLSGPAIYAQKAEKRETNQPVSVPRNKSSPAPPADPPKQIVVKKAALSPEDQKRFDAGKTVYEAACLACHQQHGLGQEGLAPPLAGSEWVAGTPERLVRIVISGLHGPIHVKKQTFEFDMPSLGVLEDEQIANVLTYVRHEWGHNFNSVTAAEVKRIRDATAKHDDAWTEEELKKIP